MAVTHEDSADRGGGTPQRSIAVLAPWVMGGGAQAALLQILNRLPVEASATAFLLFEGSTGLGRFADAGVRVVELGHPKTPAGVWRASRDLRRALVDYDAVYSLMRGSHLVLGLSPRRIVPRDARFIATFHQLPSSDSAGLRGRIEDVFVRRATRAAHLVTSPSLRGVQEIVGGRFASAARVHYEPNFIAASETPVVQPRRGRLAPVRLLFAGRLTPQKGLDRVPELLSALETPVHLRIVGSGPEESALKAATGIIPDRHVVEFVGELDDVTSEIDWADALFMPSRAELNPVVLWEARRRGRPTISSDIDAFRDLATDGGVLTFADPADLRGAVARLADDEWLRSSLFNDLPTLVPSEKGGSAIVDALAH